MENKSKTEVTIYSDGELWKWKIRTKRAQVISDNFYKNEKTCRMAAKQWCNNNFKETKEYSFSFRATKNLSMIGV